MESFYRPAKFGDELLINSLDSQVDRADSKLSESRVKRVLFERFFDPTSAFLNSSPSPLKAFSSKSNSPRADYHHASLSVTSTPTGASRRSFAAASTISHFHSPSAVIRTPNRWSGGKRQQKSQIKSHKCTLDATSFKIEEVAHLAGALSMREVPRHSKQNLKELHAEALTWSKAQVQHMCHRGVPGQIVSLLSVPGIQCEACNFLADLGRKWPPALAGAVEDVIRLLPVPLTTDAAGVRSSAFLLLEVAAGCGKVGRKAVAASHVLMQLVMDRMEAAVPKRVHKLGKLKPSPPEAYSQDVSCEEHCQPGWNRDEVWGPGQVHSASFHSSPKLSESARPLFTQSPHSSPSGGTPGPNASSDTVHTSDLIPVLRTLLTLLSNPTETTDTCRLHWTLVDATQRLLHFMVNEFMSEERNDCVQGSSLEGEVAIRAISGLDDGVKTEVHSVQDAKRVEVLKLLLRLVALLCSVSAASRAMMNPKRKQPIASILVRLLRTSFRTLPPQFEQKLSPQKAVYQSRYTSGIRKQVLHCLVSLACNADMEVRDWLREAMDDDEMEQTSIGLPSAMSCLVKTLERRPLQAKAASDSALVLLLLGQSRSLKESLLFKYKVVDLSARILVEVVQNNPDQGNNDLVVSAQRRQLEQHRNQSSSKGVLDAFAKNTVFGQQEQSSVVGDSSLQDFLGKSQNALIGLGSETNSKHEEFEDTQFNPDLGIRMSEHTPPMTVDELADSRKDEGAFSAFEGSIEHDQSVAITLEGNTAENLVLGEAAGASDLFDDADEHPLSSSFSNSAIEPLTVNIINLAVSLTVLLQKGCDKRDLAAKAVAPAVASLAEVSSQLISAEQSVPGRFGLKVTEVALALLSNLTLHERTHEVVLSKTLPTLLAMKMLQNAIDSCSLTSQSKMYSPAVPSSQCHSAATNLMLLSASLITNFFQSEVMQLKLKHRRVAKIKASRRKVEGEHTMQLRLFAEGEEDGVQCGEEPMRLKTQQQGQRTAGGVEVGGREKGSPSVTHPRGGERDTMQGEETEGDKIPDYDFVLSEGGTRLPAAATVDNQVAVDAATVDNQVAVDAATVDNQVAVDAATVDNQQVAVDAATVDNQVAVDAASTKVYAAGSLHGRVASSRIVISGESLASIPIHSDDESASSKSSKPSEIENAVGGNVVHVISAVSCLKMFFNCLRILQNLSPASSAISSPLKRSPLLPSPALLQLWQTIASATAACCQHCLDFQELQTDGQLLAEWTAITLSRHMRLLLLSKVPSSMPDQRKRMDSCFQAQLSALVALLSVGVVHPTQPGLMDNILLCVPELLSYASETAKNTTGCAMPHLLLLDELCRSKSMAVKLLQDGPAMLAIVEYCLLDSSALLMMRPLLLRLKRLDKYHALHKMFPKKKL